MRVLSLIIILIMMCSFAGKWLRYHQPAPNIDATIDHVLKHFMQPHGFMLIEQKALTSSGTYQHYVFTHPACAEAVRITPLFQSSEALSMLQARERIYFYYRSWQGDVFPRWRYLLQEGMDAIWQRSQPIPAVLAVDDISDCLRTTHTSLNQLWLN